MLERDARSVVTAFMDENEGKFRQILTALRSAVDAAKLKLGPEVVFSIYSRSDKQSDGQEFKSRVKIAAKLAEKSAADPAFTVRDIADIAGLTVVVFYNDQIGHFIEAFSLECEHRLLRIVPFESDGRANPTKIHRDRGYHATHMVLASENPALMHLRVELQIKTMLHDAWGAKMHELTYKPRGKLDHNLQILMESMGDGLQTIERQSELLRDAIAKQWVPVHRLRTAARTKLIENLLHKQQETVEAQKAADMLLARIRKSAVHLGGCPSVDGELISIIRDMNASSQVGVDPLTRLRLAIYLGSLRVDTVLATMIDDAIKDWASTKPDAIYLASVTAFAYRQSNRTEQAIDHLRAVLELDPAASAAVTLYLDLADCLLESCFYATDTKATKQEVRQLLQYIDVRVGEPGMPSRPRFNFTAAAAEIVLGEVVDLDDALSRAQQAKDELSDAERGYCDVFIGYGWQRRLSEE